MTRAAKIVYAAAAVVGLTVGITLSLLNKSLSANLADLQLLAAVAEYGDFSLTQYLHADPDHAKQALLLFISFVERAERFAPGKTQRSDVAFAYTRLALLEDAQSHPERSHKYMKNAMRWLKARGGRQPGEDQFKAAVRKLDLQLQQSGR